MSVHILVNTVKINEGELLNLIKTEYRCDMNPVPWCPATYQLNLNKDTITHSKIFSEGLFYIQNPSSLIPVCALNPQPGESILDLAAAPGGKTIHIGIRMKNKGVIIANDVSAVRVQRMKRLLELYQISIAQSVCIAGQKLWEKYPSSFDRVLVDAPCSMRGTPTPSSDEPSDLVKTQKWLLRSAYSACKPGGVIVYSTCTDTIQENEEVVDWLLQKEAGNVVVEEYGIPLEINHVDGFTQGENAQYLDHSLSKTSRIIRGEVMEGFYVACLRKSMNPIKRRHI